MNKYRTHFCSELTEKEINQEVKNFFCLLSGWLHRKRDHGNLLFVYRFKRSLWCHSMRNRK